MTAGARSGRRTVLAYHAVGACPHADRVHRCVCTSPAAFEAQVAFLARHREVVALERLVEGHVTGRRPAVAITFDDGYRNVATTAAPILERYGMPATVFVPTKWIGDKNRWDSETDCFPLEILDEDELRSLEGRGLAIESHGHAHLDLGRASPSEVTDDVEISFARLTEVLGRKPRYLAYPYGGHSATVWQAAERAGFSHAFLFDGVEAGPFAHERVSVDGREGYVRFRLKTGGGYLARRHSRAGTVAASLVRRAAPRPEDRRP